MHTGKPQLQYSSVTTKPRLVIVGQTFEACREAAEFNKRGDGEAQIWNTVKRILATNSIKCFPRSPLLSYVQVPTPCRCALPHRAMALGCQASIFGFVLCTISIIHQFIPSIQHTCCMACRRLSWQCSSGCGKASPSYELLWQWGPPLGACRRRRRSMRARRARSGRYFRRQRSAGVPRLQFLQRVGMLLDIRVKVVLLVVHPSCSHYQPF